MVLVMAKAGMEKLHVHAEEHLNGCVYDDPTPAMVNAANTFLLFNQQQCFIYSTASFFSNWVKKCLHLL
jgi:hypothetical protein